jgi:hypothetical protein
MTDLVVYDGTAVDGCAGGTPHMHTTSEEAYIVTGGTGMVQTLSAVGYAEHALVPGDVVAFTPGTVHRLVNDGELRLIVLMSNAGLPEAGDAVFTFPAEVLADAAAYGVAARLPAGESRARAVSARRDLAVTGFHALRDGGARALAAFHAGAARLVQERVDAWETIWHHSVAAQTEATRRQLQALAGGAPGALSAAAVTRFVPDDGERAWGMCGRLKAWKEEL